MEDKCLYRKSITARQGCRYVAIINTTWVVSKIADLYRLLSFTDAMVQKVPTCHGGVSIYMTTLLILLGTKICLSEKRANVSRST